MRTCLGGRTRWLWHPIAQTEPHALTLRCRPNVRELNRMVFRHGIGTRHDAFSAGQSAGPPAGVSARHSDVTAAYDRVCGGVGALAANCGCKTSETTALDRLMKGESDPDCMGERHAKGPEYV